MNQQTQPLTPLLSINPLTKEITGLKRRGNHPLTIENLETLIDLGVKVCKMMLRYNIRFETFRELLFICSMYRKDGKAVTPYAIAKASESRHKSFKTGLERIDTLIKKGLIDNVGVGYSGAKLLIPSDKALRELNALCEKEL